MLHYTPFVVLMCLKKWQILILAILEQAQLYFSGKITVQCINYSVQQFLPAAD